MFKDFFNYFTPMLRGSYSKTLNAEYKCKTKKEKMEKENKDKYSERVKESQRKWRLKNPDYDKKRILTKEQKERKKETNAIWKRNNLDKVKIHKNKYRKGKGRKVETIRRYSKQFLEKYLREIYKNQCEICKSKNNLQLHHLVYNDVLQKEVYKELKLGKGKRKLKEILMFLCKECHIKTHKGQGYLRPRAIN